MKIVNTLTLRHLKQNIKRSVITVLAIIVSVAMVTAVFVGIRSIFYYFQVGSELLDGPYAIAFLTDDSNKTIQDIEKTKQARDVGLVAQYGLATTDPKSQQSSTYLGLGACDERSFNYLSCQVSKGDYPRKQGEILLSETYVEKNNLKLGVNDKIELYVQVGQDFEEQEFTITGFTDSRATLTDRYAGFIPITDEIERSKDYSKLVYMSIDISKSYRDKDFDKIVKSVYHNDYGLHDDYLAFTGTYLDSPYLRTAYSLGGIMLIVIALVSVFMIYNSFAVSYKERSKYLGMLASVGATKAQKRASVYYEGFILGLFGLPIGLLCGIFGMKITFLAISDKWHEFAVSASQDQPLLIKVDIPTIIGIIIAVVLTIFISCYVPARRASSENIIEAIKGNSLSSNGKKKKSRKNKNRSIRVSKLEQKILGFEGVLAIKNYKRNQKRSNTIVFALALSIILLITVGSFSFMINDTINTVYGQYPDYTFSTEWGDYNKVEEILKNAENIDQYAIEDFTMAHVDEKYFTKASKENYKDSDYNARIVFVDNSSFDRYCQQLGIDSEPYYKECKAIVYNQRFQSRKEVNSQEKVFEKQVPHLSAKVRDYVDEEDVMREETLNIGCYTDEMIKSDLISFNTVPYPLIIYPMNACNKIQNESNISLYYMMNAKNVDALKEEILGAAEVSGLSIDLASQTAQMEAVNNVMEVMAVFVYGFIILITLISIINIINTISNSMNERRREFAMIKSVGITPKSFRKMICFESFRYAYKAIIYGWIIGFLISIGLNKALAGQYDLGFKFYPSLYLMSAVLTCLVIVISLLYSMDKIKDDNIIETIKCDDC